MATVGNNILNLRKSLGLTQEELAQKVGYKSKSTINKIEKGINDIPQSKILKIAEALETSPEQLIGREDDTDNNNNQSDDKISLTERERTMLELFNNISEDNKNMVIEMIRAALKAKE